MPWLFGPPSDTTILILRVDTDTIRWCSTGHRKQANLHSYKSKLKWHLEE
jgi:hypothetical protein